MSRSGVPRSALTASFALFLLLTIIAHCIGANELAEILIFTLIRFTEVHEGPFFCGLRFVDWRALALRGSLFRWHFLCW